MRRTLWVRGALFAKHRLNRPSSLAAGQGWSSLFQYSPLTWSSRGLFLAPSKQRRSGFADWTRTMTFASNGENSDKTSLLMEDLASKVVQAASLVKTQVCMAIAGGGSMAASTLAATPGASAFLLEFTLPYSRWSFVEYVRLAAKQPQWKENGNDVAAPDSDKFSFCSADASLLLALSAVQRAVQLSSQQDGAILSNQRWGLGCTSSLVTNTLRSQQRTSRAFLTLVSSWGHRRTYAITLSSDGEPQRRTRREEDFLLGQLVLWAILSEHEPQLQQQQQQEQQQLGDQLQQWKLQLLNRPGDEMTLLQQDDPPLSSSSSSPLSWTETAQAGAREILSSQRDVVILAPNGEEEDHLRQVSFLPPEIIVVPGSFNPPHVGHVALARAAIRTVVQRRQKKHATDPLVGQLWQAASFGPPPVLFELSLTNPDKPSMQEAEAARRVEFFREYQMATKQEDHVPLPPHWGIALTSAPLFVQKVTKLAQVMAHEITFVIGSDTMIRILNPKYYENGKETMLAELRNLQGRVHFVVGGRIEQIKGSTPRPARAPPKRFVSGIDELSDMPLDIQEMFTLVAEEDFRLDISSTELRKKAEEERE